MATQQAATAPAPRPSLPRRAKHGFYWVVRAVVRAIARPLIGLRIVGQENVPPTGPVLLVANHLHNFDPIVISAAMTRRVHYMGKRELFKQRQVGAFFRFVGAFPVNRQAIDRAALRHTGLLLDAGLVVGILPEGTRSTARSLTAGQPGVALIAAQRRVPILPVAVTGTQHLPFDAKGTGDGWRGRRVTVTIGKPFLLPERQPGQKPDLAGATDRIMLAIAELLPPEYQGVYREQARDRQLKTEK